MVLLDIVERTQGWMATRPAVSCANGPFIPILFVTAHQCFEEHLKA